MKSLLHSFLGKLALLAGFFLLSTSAFAQVTYTDTICAGEADVVYGVSGAITTSSYSWWLSDPAAGAIDSSVSANNSTIEIDWGTTVGTYTLYVQETTLNGCLSDTVELDIIILPLPTVAIVADSVCEGFISNLTFDLTGTAPWTIDYSDGTNTYSTTATSTPHTVALPAYTTSQTITVTGLSDANGCAADPNALPSTNVTIFPAPNAGAIFHY